jgi:hypothetical protein
MPVYRDPVRSMAMSVGFEREPKLNYSIIFILDWMVLTVKTVRTIRGHSQPRTKALCVVLWLNCGLGWARVRVARRCSTTKRLGTRLGHSFIDPLLLKEKTRVGTRRKRQVFGKVEVVLFMSVMLQ